MIPSMCIRNNVSLDTTKIKFPTVHIRCSGEKNLQKIKNSNGTIFRKKKKKPFSIALPVLYGPAAKFGNGRPFRYYSFLSLSIRLEHIASPTIIRCSATSDSRRVVIWWRRGWITDVAVQSASLSPFPSRFLSLSVSRHCLPSCQVALVD